MDELLQVGSQDRPALSRQAAYSSFNFMLDVPNGLAFQLLQKVHNKTHSTRWNPIQEAHSLVLKVPQETLLRGQMFVPVAGSWVSALPLGFCQITALLTAFASWASLRHALKARLLQNTKEGNRNERVLLALLELFSTAVSAVGQHLFRSKDQADRLIHDLWLQFATFYTSQKGCFTTSICTAYLKVHTLLSSWPLWDSSYLPSAQ